MPDEQQSLLGRELSGKVEFVASKLGIGQSLPQGISGFAASRLARNFGASGNCLQTPYGRVAAVTFVFPPRGRFLFASVLIPFLFFPQYVPHRPEDSAQRVARRPADAHFGLSALRIDCPGDQEERVLERHCLAMGSCGRCRLLLQHQPHLCR